MVFWYLATPYTKYAGGIEEAVKLACRETGRLIRAGVPVYSPIAHMHSIAIGSGMDPKDHTLWMKADESMMTAASGLIMLCAEGWDQSAGMQIEFEAFRNAGKPIVYMKPGDPLHWELSRPV